MHSNSNSDVRNIIPLRERRDYGICDQLELQMVDLYDENKLSPELYKQNKDRIDRCKQRRKKLDKYIKENIIQGSFELKVLKQASIVSRRRRDRNPATRTMFDYRIEQSIFPNIKSYEREIN